MSNTKQKTALMKVIEKLEGYKLGYVMMGEYPENIDEAIEYAKSHLPEERQQIIDAYNNGYTDVVEMKKPDGEQYFNETYGHEPV